MVAPHTTHEPQLETNEDVLVLAAIDGDEQAFGQIYDLHVEGIYRFIYVRVEDQQTAEDITSEVFLKAWEKISGYKLRGAPFRAWLYRIARNAVIDHYRTRKDKAPLEAVIDTLEDGATPLADLVGSQIEAQNILNTLKELTEDQRNVLILKFVHDLTTKEIAYALGKRQGAIRALQMRGLQALSTAVKR